MAQLRIFGEAPANRTATWHSPPTTRGTVNILWSCVITLLLCVWSAVHLNVPEYDPRNSKRSPWNPKGWVTKTKLNKIVWLIVGLLAPEMIAFMAWTQRREARKLTKLVSELLSQADESKSIKPDETPSEDRESKVYHQSIPDPEGQQAAAPASGSSKDQVEMQPIESNPSPTMQPVRRNEWTHVHSFFCIQGGFASELQTDQEKRYTLTPNAVTLLAEHNPSWIPNVSLDDIEDKSKSDGLAKSLVCIQASWFIIQCLFRLSSNGDYSISLLELNTLAHALCMLLIYWLWWDKPQDARAPISITNVPTSILIERLKFLEEMHYPRGDRHPMVQTRSRNFSTGLFVFMWNAIFTPDAIAGIGRRQEEVEEEKKRGLSFTIGFSLAGALYGGLHMLGWNAPFTSYAQQLLWRISAITVTVSGLLLPVIKFGTPVLAEVIFLPVGLLLAILIIGASVLLYLFARTYLVIECFISLAYLPESALKQPQWLASILHA